MRKYHAFYLTNRAITACLLFLLSVSAMAQESILSANNNAAGNGGSVSYSVGQVAFIANTGTSSSVTEGVQQPYEILFMEGIDPRKGITLECLLYPNPATAFIKLKIENHDIKNLCCQLNDLNGLLLQNIKIESDETVIPMEELAPAAYFLTVTENGMTLQCYKIIKK